MATYHGEFGELLAQLRVARVVLQTRRICAAAVAVHQAHPRPGLMMSGEGRRGLQRGVALRERGARADHVDRAAAPLKCRTAALWTNERGASRIEKISLHSQYITSSYH